MKSAFQAGTEKRAEAAVDLKKTKAPSVETRKSRRGGEEKERGSNPLGKGKKCREIDERIINPFHLDVNGNLATSFISFIDPVNI